MGDLVKKLFASALVPMLGGSLFLLVASSAPSTVVATSRAPSPAVVAQAHAAFRKFLSSHAPMVSHGGWVSPGPLRNGAVKSSNGTESELGSYNWSGFADAETTSQTVSDMTGRWTMPAVTCQRFPYQNGDDFLAQWIGVDGFNDSTVEQLGTAAQCYEGVTYYYVWYEMFPNGTVQEGTTACINDNTDCPRPGDRISASVQVTPGGSGENNYTLSLHDYTTPGNNFSVTQPCATDTCLDSSAEWIIERPAFSLPFGFQILPLADFWRTSFESGGVVSGGVASSIGGFSGSVNDIAMIDDSTSYFLDCVNQHAHPVSLLTLAQANACPLATPRHNGGFSVSWDAPF